MDDWTRTQDDASTALADLAPQPESAAAARRMLDPLGEHLRDDVVETAKLLVTEVVANSVVHGERTGPIRVQVDAELETLRVLVTDQGSAFEPAVALPTSGSSAGWGLFLVDTLSDRWGVRPSDRDVTVWFELDLC